MQIPFTELDHNKQPFHVKSSSFFKGVFKFGPFVYYSSYGPFKCWLKNVAMCLDTPLHELNSSRPISKGGTKGCEGGSYSIKYLEVGIAGLVFQGTYASNSRPRPIL